MNVKIGDILVTKDGMTSIGEGKVFAIGEISVVVRVTKSVEGGVNVGDLYEVRNDWFEGEHAFYEIEGNFFKVGSTYKYRDGTWNDSTRYKVIEVIRLDNPEHSFDSDTAVTIATDENGGQWVETFNKDDFGGLELA